MKDEVYWRSRVLAIRLRWRKAADRIKQLESDVSEWRRRFYSQDDPYVRDSQIKPAWDRALDELRDNRAEVVAAKKNYYQLTCINAFDDQDGAVAAYATRWSPIITRMQKSLQLPAEEK